MDKLNENYRGYFFGNMYLSSIQQGIQAAHVIQNMVVRYHMAVRYHMVVTTEDMRDAFLILDGWMRNDATIILLNGGYQSVLASLYQDLTSWTDGGRVYPIGCFYEEQAALNGALTSVGIVLPERVYGQVEEYQVDHLEYDSNDYKIRERIKSFRLAI